MSIEQKAKAYDEALDRMKHVVIVPKNEKALQALKETIFPELAESEDERIRRTLVEYFGPKVQLDFVRGVPIQKIRDWLEKQKEQNEDVPLQPIIYTEQGEVLAEQKPAEWSEDWREEDIQTRFAFYTYKDEDGVLYLSNVFVEEASRNHGFGTKILIAAEKVAETIGATTISLKVKQDSPANAWYRKNGYGYVTFEDGYDWLEKNLEYMKPNKQEWSEEDADMLNCCISSIEEAKENRYAYKETDGDTSYDREIAWLKSLRPPFKPSKEQMMALTDCIIGNEYDVHALVRLWAELKKL